MNKQSDDHTAKPTIAFYDFPEDHTEDGKTLNGVRAPTEKDAHYPVWTALNELVEFGAIPTAKTAVKLAQSMNRDVNATVVTFLQWKKFHDTCN